MSGVLFNTIPATIVAPIMAFEVNSGGNFQNESRVLLQGHASAAGTIEANVPTFPASTKEARKLSGANSMLADMYRIAKRSGATDIWIMAVADTGTAEVRTIKIDSVPAAGGVGQVRIHGELLTVEIGAGDTAASVATALSAVINGYYNVLTDAEILFSASATTDTVTITASHKGAIFNDVDIYILPNSANAFYGNTTLATPTPGVGVPDMSPALAGVDEDPWDWILSPFSDSANMARYQTLLSDVSGRWAWNRQEYGHVFTVKVGSTADITTHGAAYDTRHLTTVPMFSTAGNETAPWAWLVGIICRTTNWLMDGTNGNMARNQTGMVCEAIRAPRKRSSWPNYSTRDTFLKIGISTWKVDSVGRVLVDKIITHHQTEKGAPDVVFRDIQSIAQTIYSLRKFRARLAFEHGQKIAADDNPGSLMAISTTRDVEATLIHTHAELARGGVLENTTVFAQRLRVERNSDNANRYDVYAPLDRTNPLDIIAANATIYSQYRDAA